MTNWRSASASPGQADDISFRIVDVRQAVLQHTHGHTLTYPKITLRLIPVFNLLYPPGAGSESPIPRSAFYATYQR